MSYNYNTWLSSFSNNLVIPPSDANFMTMVPNAIDDAEQRMYRELDLLDTVVRDYSTAFTTGTRTFNLPASLGTFVVVNSIYAITPAGQTTADAGTRNPLTPASRDWLDYTFPSSTASGIPQYFAMTTQTSIVVGPWPDQAYQAGVVGTIRPTPLGPTNLTTILTVYFPDLWMAATMVFGAAYQQNFGGAGAVDNPQMPMTWESHYKTLIQSAQIEQARARFVAQGWSSKQPEQVTTPPRT